MDSATSASATGDSPVEVETVYVLSRVTLGADTKITSTILDCTKKLFPAAAIVLRR